VINATSCPTGTNVFKILSTAASANTEFDLQSPSCNLSFAVGGSSRAYSTDKINLYNETHVCFTHSNTKQNFSIYINGLRRYSTTSPSDQNINIPRFNLGSNDGSNGEYFNGTMRHVRWYNGHQLSDAEVMDVYNEDVGGIVDTTVPVVSYIVMINTTSTIRISWITNETASSSVNYGTTTSLGTVITDTLQNITHNITITGLTNNT
jgi:hypothetical protein